MSLSIIQKTIIKYWTLVSSKSKSLASLGFAYFFIFSVDIAHAGVASWVLGGIATTGILSLVILIPGLLLWLSTGMFNISLDYTVLDFYNTLHGSGGEDGSIMKAIKGIWVTVRDIANILIIGSFVYISIAKILSLNNNFKKLIINLLVVAVLINFSFFFAQTAIDITNWLSVQIYNSIMPELTVESQGLAEVIVHSMGGVEFTGEMWSKTLGVITEAINTEGSFSASVVSAIGYFLATLILTLIAAIMFFRMSFILIGRAVILFILMASSSFAFAAMLIPPFRKYWVAWRDGLIYNSIVAPLLLILLYIVTLLMMSIGDVGTVETTNTLLNDTENIDNGSFVSTFIKFLIGAGLLWGAIRIATMLASQATSSMGGLGKSINGLMNILPGALEGAAARGLGVGTYGLAGLAGRGILGRGANRVSGGLSSMADRTKSRFWQRRLNELSNNSALKNMANASYDGRQSKATQEFMKKSGINLGAGIKDGFKKIRDDRTKKEEKHDKSHIEAVRESLEADRESQAATQTAKDSQEREQKEVEKKIQSKNKEIEKLENENDKKMSDESAAESNQTKKVEQRKAAVEDIKAGKEAASHTVEESTAQIATETNKIKSIKKELTKKAKRLEDLTLGGSLNIDTAEITNLKAEIDNLNNDNTSSMNRRAGHEERLYEAESTLKESAMRETELHDAQAELRLIQSNNHISREAREKDLVSKKVEKGSLVDDNSELTQSIKEHIEVLSDYRNKFTEALSKTRIVRDAPKLSNKDVAWLTGKGVRFDDKQEVVRMPNSFIMRSMPDVEKAMLNKLLTQNKKYHTTISGEFKKLEKTKKQLKEEEVNKTFRARFADTSAESIADILNKSNNVNDDKPKPEKEASTKEEENAKK